MPCLMPTCQLLCFVWTAASRFMRMPYEPPHDKTNNVAVRPEKTQISLVIRSVWSESSLSAWTSESLGPFPLSAQRRLWCPGWSESSLGAQPHCWFCHKAAHIYYSQFAMDHFCTPSSKPLRFKYTTKFSLPKIAWPAIVYAEIVVVIDPFFVGVCPWIKVYRYNPTEIWQQRLQCVRNVAQKLCSWERSFICKMSVHSHLTFLSA